MFLGVIPKIRVWAIQNSDNGKKEEIKKMVFYQWAPIKI